jgi:Spy/CpxP family protein refolding chaperone
MQKILSAAMVALAMLVAQPAFAQAASTDVTDMQALRGAVKTDKRAFVASTMALTAEQGKKFWPVYDTYQRALDAAARSRSTSIESQLGRDKSMSDLAAKQVVKQQMLADETEMKARRKMVNALMRPLPAAPALPASKIARYLQLEAKIRAVQAYDIAQTFPLVK